MYYFFVCLIVPFFVIDIPSLRFEHRINKFTPYLCPVIAWRTITLDISIESLYQFGYFLQLSHTILK